MNKTCIALFLLVLVSCSKSVEKEKFLKEVIYEKFKSKEIKSYEIVQEKEGKDLNTLIYVVRVQDVSGEISLQDSLQYSATGDGHFQLYKPL